MPKKEKVRNAVRKLKAEVEARAALAHENGGGKAAYRALEEGDEHAGLYADTPGGRGDHAPATMAYAEARQTRSDDVVLMDASLATPIQLPFGAGAFEKAVANASLADVDFDLDEPASTMRPGGAVAIRIHRHRGGLHDDGDFIVHAPARQNGEKHAGGAGSVNHGHDVRYFEDRDLDGDGIELLKIRSSHDASASPSGEDSHGGGSHGIPRGKITNTQTFFHVLKSYIGSGVLGLPYAFSQGGMFAGMTGMATVSVLSTLCVFLLLDCKRRLSGRVRSFGDVGYGALGRSGHVAVELTVVLSQLGFCCAYLIFVSQNLFLYLHMVLASEASIIWCIVPFIVALTWIPSLDVLAPFSMMALALIFGGLGIVAWHAAPLAGTGPDVQGYVPSTVPIFVGMAIYSFEGIGLALPIQNQMLHPDSFKVVWFAAMLVVTATYVSFGAFCYSCYGDEVPSIITMVLPDNFSSLLVKFGLSVALIFTYPIAMFPVIEIVEDSWAPSLFKAPAPPPLPVDSHSAAVDSDGRNGQDDYECKALTALWRRRFVRAGLVLITATAAVSIPDFSIVMAFIGSVPSNIMAFFLPALFHLVICWRVMGFWGRLFDVTLLLSAVGAVTVCTWTTVFGLINHLEIP